MQLAHDFQRQGVRLNTVAVNLLIHALGKAGEWKQAMEVCELCSACCLPIAHCKALVSGMLQASLAFVHWHGAALDGPIVLVPNTHLQLGVCRSLTTAPRHSIYHS